MSPDPTPDNGRGPTEEDLRALISDEVEESLRLEYKAAGALAPTHGKKKEVTKDVSAMANSAGGRIIYGIAEHDEEERQHLPKCLDPVDRTEFSKERLEQVINNIRPRIEGLTIFPVPLTSGDTDVAYVVDVPKSSTAHQAQDNRYYKRYNFQTIPMEDHEVRDVMGRSQHPEIAVHFGFNREIKQQGSLPVANPFDSRSAPTAKFYLEVWAENTGSMIARHVVIQLHIPAELFDPDDLSDDERDQQDIVRWCKNTHRDVVDVEVTPTGGVPKYGPSRYDPMLPGLARQLKQIRLHPQLPMQLAQQPYELSWTVHADEAPPVENSRELTLEHLERELKL